MADNKRTRTPSGVDATNVEQGLARQEQLQDEASENDFVQLMYEQSSELDAVDRITRERKQRR